ncbi:MAG: YceI family protein [Gemmatimonadota bacterium]
MNTTTTDSGTATLNATTWKIDPQHTEVGFEVSHMMFAKVRGRFEEVEGTVIVGPEGSLENSRVEAVMQAASISTGNSDRDEHLRSGDFFDVDQYPVLTFESKAVRRLESGDLAVTGTLTIRDVSREVELAVTETGRGTDPWGNERIGFSATTKIDRRDFDLTWNQALETGGILVGNDIGINLEVQAVRQTD